LALTPLLKDQIGLWRRTLPASIKIILTGEENDYIIYADKTRIQQLFTNLVFNARDAMPQGGKLQLNLSHHRVDPLQIKDPAFVSYPALDVGDWVQITLSDSGTGIPPAALLHVFEPFFTTKKPGQGSGLGLAQVLGIVEQHKGHIDVQTEAGKGTTFTIYLPMQIAMEPLAETAVPPKAKSPKGHEETILIVDDNAVLREALEGALDLLNYRTMTANNGREALAVLTEKDHAIAMVLCDLIMPEMGGKALLQAIREQGLTLPVVMMSGHPMETAIKALDEWALEGWLLKPIDMRVLATALDQALRKA
jgi:CheY-like chemotaxis protein